MSKFFRIYHKDGGQTALGVHQQANGLLTVEHSYFDAKGYYIGYKSFTSKNWDKNRLFDEIESVKKFETVKEF